MKILVIPDIHLKPWIVRLSVSIMNELIETEQTQPETERQETGAVFLGDVADDFGKQEDLALYTETYDEVISFLKMFPASWFCIGNHDISYVWEKDEAGYLQDFAPYACDRLQVVGHTPMAKVQFEEKYNLLSADVFSTQPDGKPVGEISDLRFVVVDTIEKTFRYADELVSCISPGQISSFYPQD